MGKNNNLVKLLLILPIFFVYSCKKKSPTKKVVNNEEPKGISYKVVKDKEAPDTLVKLGGKEKPKKIFQDAFYKGWFKVDGEPFFIAGIGYEAHSRPGETPFNNEFKPDDLRKDFKLIKEAGFNTLRTWAPMTDKEIKLADEFGLKILMGIWIDAHSNFGDEKFIKDSINTITTNIERLKKWDNIIGYIIMNEPFASDVLNQEQDFKNLFSRIVSTIKSLGDKKPIMSSSSFNTDFLPMNELDTFAMNLYPYNPKLISKTLGYKLSLEYLKKNVVNDRPFIITEYGLSVSPKGEGKFGYGGNTLEEQNAGVLSMTQDIINSGIAGYCSFIWHDGWWKNNEYDNDEQTHDPEAEEWFGFMGITGDLASPVEKLRPIYNSIKKEQKYLASVPTIIKYKNTNKSNYIKIPIICPLRENITLVNVSVAEAPFIKTILTKGKYSYYGFLEFKPVSKLNSEILEIFISWMDSKDNTIHSKRKSIKLIDEDQLALVLDPISETAQINQPITISGELKGINFNNPDFPKDFISRTIRIGVHIHNKWDKGDSYEVKVDGNNKFSMTYNIPADAKFLSIAAAYENDLWDSKQVRIKD